MSIGLAHVPVQIPIGITAGTIVNFTSRDADWNSLYQGLLFLLARLVILPVQIPSGISTGTIGNLNQ